MTRIVHSRGPERSHDPKSRPYRSRLREEQATSTRGRILDATMRVMARGIASLSIPHVAREAGVSTPTVYRYFGTKQDLLDALYQHAEERAGRGALVTPRTIAELQAGVRHLIDNIDAFDDVTRAAMASPGSEEVRHRSMPRRLGLARAMVDTIEPPLPEEGRDRIARLVVILTSSSALRTWRDHLGVSPERVAEEVEGVVRAAIAAERQVAP